MSSRKGTMITEFSPIANWIRKTLLLTVIFSSLFGFVSCRGFSDAKERPGEIEYVCSGNVIYLLQNAPSWVTEDDYIVAVVSNFWREDFVNDVGNTSSRDTIALDIWNEGETGSAIGKRVGVGDHMEFRGYRFTVLSIRMPSSGPEPDGIASVCVERITINDKDAEMTRQTP